MCAPKPCCFMFGALDEKWSGFGLPFAQRAMLNLQTTVKTALKSSP